MNIPLSEERIDKELLKKDKKGAHWTGWNRRESALPELFLYRPDVLHPCFGSAARV